MQLRRAADRNGATARREQPIVERPAPGAFAWWQRGIIYQIYPRSFQDSNGDGIGDLPGILSRLDYLTGLGVDAIWISPLFPSPMADFGYDVSDYTAIDPVFGTLADFDRLVAAAHRRGLKIILDYVANHTSDQHPWFIESRSSRNNQKRDWYIWRDAKADGGPPNNWIAEFGGSAWQWDERTGQYYYHAFLKEQPDLNWRNPQVRRAMLDVLRFWLERGVDGFRVDAVHHLFEDHELRDNPPNLLWRPGLSPARSLARIHTLDRPEVHAAVAAMRAVSDQYAGDPVLIGEVSLPIEQLMAYYGPELTGFHMPFNFHLIKTEWSAEAIASLIRTYEAALPAGGWPNWVLGNHDRARLASRIGPAQARVAAMLLLTLRGTPTIYQGEEIGMADVPVPPERVQDPWEKNVPGIGLGRDPVRTPMQWDASVNAGFTTGMPWLPLAADHAKINVSVEAKDSHSMLALYRRLIALRRAEPALSIGTLVSAEARGEVLIYERRHRDRRITVALNFSELPQEVEDARADGDVLLSTYLDAGEQPVAGVIALRPHEGVVIAAG